MVTGALDGEAATAVAAMLMALDAEGDDPVSLLVNSPGGPVEAGVAVVDVLDLLGVPVEATCFGQAVGTAAVVVACATPGRRRAAPNARLSLRLAEGALEGPAGRLEREAADLLALRDRLVDRLVEATGRPRDERGRGHRPRPAPVGRGGGGRRPRRRGRRPPLSSGVTPT